MKVWLSITQHSLGAGLDYQHSRKRIQLSRETDKHIGFGSRLRVVVQERCGRTVLLILWELVGTVACGGVLTFMGSHAVKAGRRETGL